MQKWEYLTLYIFLDDSLRDYYIDTKKVGRIYGFGQIFDYYGEQGWELVNVLPTYFDGFRGGPVTGEKNCGRTCSGIQQFA